MEATANDSTAVAELSALLAEWHGTRARVWRYHASLSRLTLCIFSKNQSEHLFLMTSGCEYLRGLIGWQNNAIQLVTLIGLHERTVIGVIDPAADFVLRCRNVHTHYGQDYDFDG